MAETKLLALLALIDGVLEGVAGEVCHRQRGGIEKGSYYPCDEYLPIEECCVVCRAAHVRRTLQWQGLETLADFRPASTTEREALERLADTFTDNADAADIMACGLRHEQDNAAALGHDVRADIWRKAARELRAALARERGGTDGE